MERQKTKKTKNTDRGEKCMLQAYRQEATNSVWCAEKHKKFTSLTGHIQDSHEEFAEKWEIQVLVHTGRGMLERTKEASVDFARIPEPRTDQKWDTYEEIVAQLQDGGVPIYGVLERQVVLRERYLAANPQMQFKQLELMDQAGPSAQGASTSFPSV
ncbi:hypothetical protein OSTOST_13286 [Ostertagia ostertagi]